ncbi:MAG: FAD-binding protein [Candidatus Latescibacteria bacterium]|nr:FAD-binding protein [Candidatus Latescibacterota bacterium]
MEELRVATQAGGDTTLDCQVLEAFQASLHGRLLFGADDGYEQARTLHNGMIDRRPALVVNASGPADVMAAVNLCRDHDLLFSVRGGGHSVAGFSACQGGVMTNLAGMNGVRVDPQAMTLRCAGGATWGDVDHETQALGLATTGGVAPTTGVGGYTLGGGLGYLMRKHGLACDNLISADVVTAAGELVTASADDNADLFWGLRGGGGNFGIVTSFESLVHPLEQIYGGMIAYPIDATQEVLRLYREISAAAPEELGAAAAVATHPEAGPMVGLVFCYSGPLQAGEKLLRPFRDLRPILVDMLGPCPYKVVQNLADAINPPGMRNYWKSNYLRQLSDDLVDVVVDHYQTAPSPYTHVVWETLGGAMGRVPSDATAFGDRGYPFNCSVFGLWEEADQDEGGRQWVRDLSQALQPWAGGVYTNYMDRPDDEGHERLRAAYGPEGLARLAALKRKYDPANMFRMNQNIAPAG